MFKPQIKQLINVDRIELKPSNVRKSQPHRSRFQPIASRFPQLLKCDTDMYSLTA